MAITLEEIAKLCHVSRSTVSRVINGDPNVKDETRQRVLEVINRLDFQPNLAARSLAAGYTNVIGLVIPAGFPVIFTDPYFPLLVQGVSSGCNQNEYSVMLWLNEPKYERKMIRRILHSGLLDGVIVSSMLMDDPIVQALHESRMPFVLIGRHPVLDVNYIDIDNQAGAYEAIMHLIALGHKKIATITGPKNMIAGNDRFQGYQNALAEANISFDADLVVEGDFSGNSGYLAMQELIPRRPSAVFIANDTMAEGALRATREASLRIPEDIAIVGYDDIPNAAKTHPSLTTIRQPIQEMGAAAVETLIEIIRRPQSESKRIILPTELVIRESCGSK